MGPNKKMNAGMSKKKSQKRFRVNWVLDDGSMAPILQPQKHFCRSYWRLAPSNLIPPYLNHTCSHTDTLPLSNFPPKQFLNYFLVLFNSDINLKLLFSSKCQQSIYYLLLYSMSMANLYITSYINILFMESYININIYPAILLKK
jgi:hypothetical protein